MRMDVSNRWIRFDGVERATGDRRARIREEGALENRSTPLENRSNDMGATLTLPHAIETFYRGDPVTDADAFARAFAPDATLEFIGPHAPKDEKGGGCGDSSGRTTSDDGEHDRGIFEFHGARRRRADALDATGRDSTRTRD